MDHAMNQPPDHEVQNRIMSVVCDDSEFYAKDSICVWSRLGWLAQWASDSHTGCERFRSYFFSRRAKSQNRANVQGAEAASAPCTFPRFLISYRAALQSPNNSLLFGDSESFESEDVRFWEGRRSKVPTSHVNRSCALDHILVCSTITGAAQAKKLLGELSEGH